MQTQRTIPYRYRLAPLGALLATLSMMTVKTRGYGGYFAFPGARTQIIVSALLVAAYAVVLAIPRLTILRFAFLAALVSAAIECLHLVQERFWNPPGQANGAITLAFMLATFMPWGWVARTARTRGMHFSAACGAAVLSAILTMAIAVCLGTFFEWFVAPIPSDSMKEWPEFQRSGWNDLAAFAIGNTVDSITSHLMMAPVIGFIFGAAGSAIGRMQAARNGAAHDV